MIDKLIKLKKLGKLGKEVSHVLSNQNYVKIVSHHDADGIAAASIMCNALYRSKIHFQTRIISRFDENVVDELNKDNQKDLIIFCDMGSSYPHLISKVSGDIIVIDHHKPISTDREFLHVNPHLVGIDGAYELSASGVAYIVATEMSNDNIDLGGLAIVGAIGDKQLTIGANKLIIEESIKNKVIDVKKGLRIGDGDIQELLEYTIEPYLDITGDREAIKNFLDQIKVHGKLRELESSQLHRLVNAITLKLLKKASPDAIEFVIGEVYILNKEIIKNVFDYVWTLNACSKYGELGIALSLGMRDSSALEEAKHLSLNYQRKLVSLIKYASQKVKQKKYIRYVNLIDSESTGVVAGTLNRYLYPDKPFITFNTIENEGITRVSARGTKKLIKMGLDLSIVLREAAQKVGGNGGGHNIASGAGVPIGKEEEFLDIVDKMVGEQIKPYPYIGD
ncbi:MAG: DHHA1 domain-containing protein [Methanosarcinales archaeon]